jgi:hypothetical protein
MAMHPDCPTFARWRLAAESRTQWLDAAGIRVVVRKLKITTNCKMNKETRNTQLLKVDETTEREEIMLRSSSRSHEQSHPNPSTLT